MRNIDLYWSSNDDWFYIKNGNFFLTDKATPEAIESYKRYKKQLKEGTWRHRFSFLWKIRYKIEDLWHDLNTRRENK